MDTSEFAFPKPERKLKRSAQKRNTLKHKGLRSAVYAKNRGNCYLCSKPIPTLKQMTIEHVVPRGMGGPESSHDIANLMPADGKCNSRKGSRRILKDVSCPNCGHGVVVGGSVRGIADCFKCGHVLTKES